MIDFCITEEGRVLDLSPLELGKGILELVEGKWVPAISPVSGEDIWYARPLSEDEIQVYLE